jgi:pimeloyl-ACP methyl ester carboxylesterase
VAAIATGKLIGTMNDSKRDMYDIDGAQIACRLAGDRNAPPLLLIHGFPSSSASFRNVIDTLARRCFVIAPDLPGFGASEPIESPSFSRFADIIEGLLAQIGIETVHLYLHDYGAAVGLYLATRGRTRFGVSSSKTPTRTRAEWDQSGRPPERTGRIPLPNVKPKRRRI